MRAFNLNSLLKSQDLQLVRSSSSQELDPHCHETLIWADTSGPLTISRVDSDDACFYRLRLGQQVAVDVTPENRLAVLPAPDTPRITVDHFLADQVFPRILSQGDDLVLHTGAVRDDGRALLLLGASGSGKSTLVTSFHQSGWTLMGDDAVVLSIAEEVPTARAVYPSLRLFPDSMEALFTTPVASRAMAHYSDKQRLDVAIERKDSGSAAVSAIVVLGSDGPVTVRPLSRAEACMAMVENSFALDPTDRGRARQRLERASQLAHAVPAFVIDYPRDYARLPAVREAILSAVAGDRPLRH